MVEDAGWWCWTMFVLFLASLVLFLLFDALVVVYVPSLSLSWRWWLKMLIDDDLCFLSLSLVPFSLCVSPLYIYLEDAGWRCWLMMIYDMCPCPWFPCPCVCFLFILVDAWGNWSVKQISKNGPADHVDSTDHNDPDDPDDHADDADADPAGNHVADPADSSDSPLHHHHYSSYHPR